MGPLVSWDLPSLRRLARLWAILVFSTSFQLLHAVQVNGVEYTGLREISANLGMNHRWLEKGRTMQLESEWTKMRFELHRREIILNNMRLFMGFPVVEIKDRLHISADDFRYLIQPILTPQLFRPVPGLRHIVIDPGHGGDDPGSLNEPLKLREKSLTLDLSKRLERKLKQHGFAVSLTRREDVFIPLEERSQKANRLKGDLFISIHFNALERSEVSGIETYALTPLLQPSTSRSKLEDSDRQAYRGQKNGPWNTLSAYYVQRSLVDSIGALDRGLKRAQFTVLLDLEMPGILVEGGFVSHPSEGRNIGSAAYRDRLVDAIVEGVLVYQRTLNRLSKRVP